MSQTKPAPHPFQADPELPHPTTDGRRVCRCGLVGRPGDAHHDMPDAPDEDARSRAAGDTDP
jgi:hypothetical protein